MPRYTARDAERPLRALRTLIGRHGVRDAYLVGSVRGGGSSEKDVDIAVDVPERTRLMLIGDEDDDGRAARLASAVERVIARAGCGYDKDPWIVRRNLGYPYHRGLSLAEVRRRLGVGAWDADIFNTSCPSPSRKRWVPVDVFVGGIVG